MLRRTSSPPSVRAFDLGSTPPPSLRRDEAIAATRAGQNLGARKFKNAQQFARPNAPLEWPLVLTDDDVTAAVDHLIADGRVAHAKRVPCASALAALVRHAALARYDELYAAQLY